jgi:hypothetical protein
MLGLNSGPTILGVQTRTVHDVVYQNGKLVETTEDHYAQDTNGNVWYMGEDATNFLYDANGNPTGMNHEGSWRGGVNGALPGFAMPSNLTVGFSYFQESAQADNSVDQAQTFAVGKTIAIPLGTFPNVLQVLETSAVEPDVREFKFYAPGVGLILDQDLLDPNLENPQFQLQLTSLSVVPLPPAFGLLASALAALGIGMIGRKRI